MRVLLQRVFHVRGPEDIQQVVRLARANGVQVSCRGTQHTMGGHTIATGGYVIDCKNLRQLSFDPSTGVCVTGPGNTWADLIKMLNEYGFSPRTMQSYCTFSVGGSIAVGAHGITTDFPVSESVLSCKIVDAEGNLRELKQGDEEIKYVCGGYGLFGIIYEVVMKVDSNHHLSMDMLDCDLASFPQLFDAVVKDPQVDIKLARLDVTNLDKLTIFVFRNACVSNVRTVSALPTKPREMTTKTRLMYKWLAPSMQQVRGIIESVSGSAVDWVDANERNLLMYESAQPLVDLYSPILDIDDTFVLQEYFVPKSQISQWVSGARAYYSRALQSERVTILNTTIRVVEKDVWSALPYAPHAEGSAAFVLYWRIERNATADAELAGFHRDFAALTVSLGGRFYLPYRHHYSQTELLQAYPEFPEWVAAKQKRDPECLFSNEWFEHYGMPFWSGGGKKPHPSPVAAVHAWDDGDMKTGYTLPIVSERHRHSMQKRFTNAFRDEFLVNIFILQDNVTLSAKAAKVAQAVMRARMQDLDDQVAYVTLRRMLEKDHHQVRRGRWRRRHGHGAGEANACAET